MNVNVKDKLKNEVEEATESNQKGKKKILDEDQRVLVRYSKGATYKVRKSNLIPGEFHANTTSFSCSDMQTLFNL